MEHELKILPQYFAAVKSGEKTFELRKNDRNYKIGDTLLLKEWEYIKGKYVEEGYTGNKMKKEISYILEGGQYGLEEGYCILGLKEEGIKLKNINLTGISKDEQLRKTKEELKELVDALIEDEFYSDIDEADKKELKDHIKEEFWDLVQSHLGVLEKHGITAEEVQTYYPKHLKKLEKRPREKKCSKCINCELTEYTDRESVLFCHQGVFVTYEEVAKDCKCYEEMEE